MDPTLTFNLSGAYSDVCPKFTTEDDLNFPGALFHFDSRDVAGVPVHNQLLTNRAAAEAATLLSATTADVSIPYLETLAAGQRTVEKTAAEGLHVRASDIVTQNTYAAVRYPEVVRNYILANFASHDYYLAVWDRATRPTVNSMAVYMTRQSAGNANYLYYDQQNDPDILPKTAPQSLGNTSIDAFELGELSMRSVGIRGWTGDSTGSLYSSFAYKIAGSSGPLQVQEAATAPSNILYFFYFVDLTVANKTFDEVDALVLELFTNAQVGRLATDTWFTP